MRKSANAGNSRLFTFRLRSENETAKHRIFIGLTLVLVSFGYCYEAYNYEFTINTIFVGIILFIPLGLIGLALIKSGAAKTDNASLFLFGSIWVGVMCFGFAALMIWKASQFPPGGRCSAHKQIAYISFTERK